MTAYLVRRTLLAAFTLGVISFLTFVVIQLPEGDYVDYYMVQGCQWTIRCNISVEEQELMREELGLNQPMMVQYGAWIADIVFRGDFGHAQSVNAPIRDVVVARVPVTVFFAAFTIVIVWSLSIPIGIYSAVRQHSIGDYAFTFLGFTGLAVPDFLLALVLMYVSLAYFNQSVGGLFSGEYQNAAWSVGKVLDGLKHMIIPSIVLGTAGLAGNIRIMRNNLLDELNKPYVVTARARGMVNWRLIAKYPVRVAINPFVSGIGGMLPALMGGSIIVSIVLSIPTLGPILLLALQRQDQFLAGTIVLLLASLTVVGVLISDLLLVVVDPRIKLTGPSV